MPTSRCLWIDRLLCWFEFGVIAGAGAFVPVPVAFWTAGFEGTSDGLFVTGGVCAVWIDGGDGR